MRVIRILFAVMVAVALGVGVLILDGGLQRLNRAWVLAHLGQSEPTTETRAALKQDLAAAGIGWGTPLHIRIYKHESELEVWFERDGRYRRFRTYPICRWSGALGPKLKEGDRQAPEGFYQVGLGQLNPNSRHHLSFNLGYPNRFDRSHGRTGSYLMVHGGCSSAGCYAMTDRSVDDIYRLVEAALRDRQKAVPVHIFPFRMTAGNWNRLARPHSEWHGFWRQLQMGYDAFERTGLPPRMTVQNGRYVVDGAVKLTKR